MVLVRFVFFLIVALSFYPGLVKMDYAEPWQMLFQDPGSPIAEGIINLHHDLHFALVLIAIFVSWMIFRSLQLFIGNISPTNITHGETIEVIWTITPAFILVLIGIPSFTLLYSMDEAVDPALTLKVIGRQWYWTYEYSDYALSSNGDSIIFDSYMILEEDLEPGDLRLLEVDNEVVLPINTHIRVLVTGADVIHCWAVPSLAVKIDALPGRLNQIALYINREGKFYGQCSEICGVNHGFMPIVIKAVSMKEYLNWVEEQV